MVHQFLPFQSHLASAPKRVRHPAVPDAWPRYCRPRTEHSDGAISVAAPPVTPIRQCAIDGAISVAAPPMTPSSQCGICLDTAGQGPQLPFVLQCSHIFCHCCMATHAKAVARAGTMPWCALCRRTLSPSELQALGVEPPAGAPTTAIVPPLPRESPRSARAFRNAARNGFWKHCPECSAVIQKSGGCDNMRCCCGCRFRWSTATPVVQCWGVFRRDQVKDVVCVFRRDQVKDVVSSVLSFVGSGMAIPLISFCVLCLAAIGFCILCLIVAWCISSCLSSLNSHVMGIAGANAASLRSRLGWSQFRHSQGGASTPRVTSELTMYSRFLHAPDCRVHCVKA
eukprot:NODE_4890_length_1833_cov_23.322392.p1 GENE.NODE_4890_length_1833_cov_23.322392~~NODE_4890_length_1833_cov_23.322392.p1  ORF type:complete len:340 (+),score=42.99 NODE_4890_length_1833_cov_23.322392:312-1331(+)